MIAFILIWVAIIGLEVWRNYHIIEIKKQSPNYVQSFVFRGIAGIAYGIVMDLVLGYFPSNLGSYSYWGLFKILWPLLFFQLMSFVTLFNLSLNLLRNKDFDYLGENSGVIDKAIVHVSGRWAEKVYFIAGWLLFVWSVVKFLSTGPK